MTQEEYVARVLALAAEAHRIKDNKSIFSTKKTENEKKPLPETLINEEKRIFPLMEITRGSLSSLLGRKWKNSLLPVLCLCELYKFRTSTKESTILFLPTTSKYLTDVFGNARNVSNAIKRSKMIGLTICVDENYKFGVSDSRSKLYAWNKDAERKILEFCKAEGIHADIPRSVTMKRILKDFGKNTGWIEKADGFVIKITQKTALPKNLTDEEVIEAILVRYPEIKYAMEVAVELNKHLPENEQISCIPKITRSKSGTITKIGFRITNPIVSAKVHDNQNSDYHGPWLKDVLSASFGRWVEYDVKSSIYRVAHLLTYGKWLPDSVDLYEEIAGFEFPSSEYRNFFKVLAMSLYFENSAKSLVAHYKAKGMALQDSEELLRVIDEARERMRQVCGESLRSEIFVAESCIYLEAFRRMTERGWRVIQVYDGFYIKDGDENTVEEARNIVEESAYWYYNKYKRV